MNGIYKTRWRTESVEYCMLLVCWSKPMQCLTDPLRFATFSFSLSKKAIWKCGITENCVYNNRSAAFKRFCDLSKKKAKPQETLVFLKIGILRQISCDSAVTNGAALWGTTLFSYANGYQSELMRMATNHETSISCIEHNHTRTRKHNPLKLQLDK